MQKNILNEEQVLVKDEVPVQSEFQILEVLRKVFFYPLSNIIENPGEGLGLGLV
jgi:hypothetical protein